MKITITKEQLNSIIQEEVHRLNRIQELTSKHRQLKEMMQKLQEGQDIDELWGGIKHLFNKGSQAATSAGNAAMNKVGQAANAGYNAAKSTVQGMGQDLKQAGQDVANVGRSAVGAVSNAANSVKQTYQQGEKMQKISNTEAAIKKAWSQKKALINQIASLQTQYQQLTGKPYQPQKFASKNPGAVAMQNPLPGPGDHTTSTGYQAVSE